MLRRLALLAAALTGVPLAIAWVISNVIMHPRKRIEDHTLDDFGLSAEPISFPSRDGTRLSGWFIPAERSPAPGIVLSHGWARSRAELLPHANFLHRAGYAAFMFDYRHRGESDGDAITMGLRERDDLLGAIDTLTAQPEVDPTRLGALGMSMGGVISLLVAADDQRLRALVVECPYSSPDVITSRSLRHYAHLPSFPLGDLAKLVLERRIGGSLADVDPSAVVAGISPRPIFVIAAGRDAVVGCDETERLFRAAAEPKRFWLVPGANHARCWQEARKEYEERVLNFFSETILAARAPSEALHSA
jgi:dipeptidyl aminopeptidase/acylaminoacyl peptidase